MTKNTAYLTTAEAAADLGVSVRLVQHWIAEGRLSAERKGRDWLILSTALETVRLRPGRGRPTTKKNIGKNSS